MLIGFNVLMLFIFGNKNIILRIVNVIYIRFFLCLEESKVSSSGFENFNVILIFSGICLIVK